MKTSNLILSLSLALKITTPQTAVADTHVTPAQLRQVSASFEELLAGSAAEGCSFQVRNSRDGSFELMISSARDGGLTLSVPADGSVTFEYLIAGQIDGSFTKSYTIDGVGCVQFVHAADQGGLDAHDMVRLYGPGDQSVTCKKYLRGVESAY